MRAIITSQTDITKEVLIPMLKSRTVSKRWFISYLLILMIPLVICGTSYIAIHNKTKEETKRYNEVVLSQLKDKMEYVTLSQQKLFASVTLNSHINEIHLLPQGSKKRFHFANDLRKSLDSSMLSEPMVESTVLYFKNIDMAITPSSYFDGLNLYNTYFNKALSKEEFQKLINGTGYFNEIFLCDTDSGEQKIIVIQNIADYNNRNDNIATMCIVLNKQYLLQTIENMNLPQESFVTILDNKNEILLSTDPSKSDDIDFKMFNETAPSNTSFEQGANIFSYTYSQYNKLKFVLVSSKTENMRTLIFVRTLTIFTLTITFILGLLLCFFIARKNYSPLKKIIEQIENAGDNQLKKEVNEFDFISEYFSSTQSDLEEKDLLVKMQKKAISDNLLYRILKEKKLPSGSDKTDLSSFEIDFENDSFVVTLISPSNIELILQKSKDLSVKTASDFFNLILTGILNKLGEDFYRYFVIDADDAVAVLFVIKPQNYNSSDEITLLIQNCSDYVKTQFGFSLTAGISAKNSGENSIHKCYKQALHALSYAKFFNVHTVTTFESISTSNNIYAFSIEQEMQLLNFVRSGDNTKACALINEILDHSIKNSNSDINATKVLIYDIFASLMKSNSNVDNSVFDLKQLDVMLEEHTVQELYAYIKEKINTLCQANEEHNAQNTGSIEKLIYKYIEENYHDRNLSVTMIGDHFKTTPAYLSKIFKTRTNQSILDYINYCRVKKSKEYILSGEYTLDKIATLVGYWDARALLRAFKKVEGITPSKFREMNGKQEL